jgi:PsbP
MQMGMSQVDLAILLPAFAAAWNLVGGQTLFAAQKDSGRVYLSPDGLFAVEAPAGWEIRTQEGSNEVTFLNGQVSVSVAAAETEAGDTVDQFLEVNKSLVRHMCPAAEVLAEGKATVAGASGAYFTMFCPGSRARTIVRVAAALSHKRLFVFKIAAPSAELYAVQATIDSMAHSFSECDGLPQCGKRRQRAN